MKCSKCGTETENKFCPNCGAEMGKPQPQILSGGSPKQTKLCKHCKTEIDKNAKVCPNCRKKQSKGALPIVIGVVVVFFIIGALSSKSGSKDSNATVGDTTKATKATTATATTASAIDVQADDINTMYKDNQVSCKQQYDGKLLAVSGVVASIGEDITGNTYITLTSDEYNLLSIQCYFSDKAEISKIASITKGSTITVVGTGDIGTIKPMLKNSKLQ